MKLYWRPNVTFVVLGEDSHQWGATRIMLASRAASKRLVSKLIYSFTMILLKTEREAKTDLGSSVPDCSLGAQIASQTMLSGTLNQAQLGLGREIQTWLTVLMTAVTQIWLGFCWIMIKSTLPVSLKSLRLILSTTIALKCVGFKMRERRDSLKTHEI